MLVAVAADRHAGLLHLASVVPGEIERLRETALVANVLGEDLAHGAVAQIRVHAEVEEVLEARHFGRVPRERLRRRAASTFTGEKPSGLIAATLLKKPAAYSSKSMEAIRKSFMCAAVSFSLRDSR